MVAFVSRLLRRVVPALALLWCAPPAAQAQPVTQPFTFSIVRHTLPHVAHATAALGDYDNDGDLDVFLSGIADGNIVTALYRNDGVHVRDDAATFIFSDTGTGLPGVVYGSAAWGDYDRDGDVDLVITGSRSIEPPYKPVSLLYRNEDGVLVETGVDLEGYHSGAAAWGDYDNDGDLDLLLGGEREGGSSATRLYRFSAGTLQDSELDLPGIAYGDAEWGDMDEDGDLDLLLSGVGADGIYTDVYRNDGSRFASLEAGFASTAFADVGWGDYDLDGDLDVIQAGGQISPNVFAGLTRVYRNTDSQFDSLAVGMKGALSGAGTWGDYDNDGDLDLLVMGAENDVFSARTARIFANEQATFAEKIHLIGVIFGAATWGDVDGDGDLDLLVSGNPTVGDAFVNLYENRRQVTTVPAEPAALTADVDVGSATLHWQAPAEGAATYNLRVGTKPGRGDVVPPMSDAETGRRLLSSPGNVQQNRSWSLRGLAPGTYYWSVQSLDYAFGASKFAPENQFTVSQATAASEPDDETVPMETRLHPAAPNPSSGPFSLRYDLARPSATELRIYDLLGRVVARLADGDQAAGQHRVTWDPATAGVASGLYLCELRSGSYRETITLVVSR